MRTGTRVGIALLLVAVATGIGVVAYQVGIDAGVASGDGTEVVRIVGGGWRGGPGFFPGFLFFPLFVFGFFFLARFVFWPWGRGRGWDGPPGPRHHDGGDRAADWHRRQHEAVPNADPGGDRSTGPAGSWPGADD